MSRRNQNRSGEGSRNRYDWRKHIRPSNDPEVHRRIRQTIDTFMSCPNNEQIFPFLDPPIRNTYKHMCENIPGVGFIKHCHRYWKLVKIDQNISPFALLAQIASQYVESNNRRRDGWLEIRWLLRETKKMSNSDCWMGLQSIGISNFSEKKLYPHEEELRKYFEISHCWKLLRPYQDGDKASSFVKIEHCKPVLYDDVRALNELDTLLEKACKKLGLRHTKNDSQNKAKREPMEHLAMFGHSVFFAGSSSSNVSCPNQRETNCFRTHFKTPPDFIDLTQDQMHPSDTFNTPPDFIDLTQGQMHSSDAFSDSFPPNLTAYVPPSRGDARVYNTRKNLPAFQHSGLFLKKILQNDVLVLCGATGCGKTTQLPQILMDYVHQHISSNFKVICTQPRRISATSVAQRVAFERGEAIGAKVGYQIRFEKKMRNFDTSRHATAINEVDRSCCDLNTQLLYCTVGILLRFLITNPTLKGVDCVIVDEVHERGLHTDFVLLILRDVCKLRKRNNEPLKLVLMSATIDATAFLEYFSKPIYDLATDFMEIPGKTNFAIEELFVEDVLKEVYEKVDQNSMIQTWNNHNWEESWSGVSGNKHRNQDWNRDRIEQYLNQYFSRSLQMSPWIFNSIVSDLDTLLHRDLKYDVHLIVKTVQLIEAREDEYRKRHRRHLDFGAVLIFVPGWKEITDTIRALEKIQPQCYSSFKLLPLHSMVPPREQHRIFHPVSMHERKIIISTNLAETSITVEDIIYVIDSGLTKSTTYTPETNIASLETLQCAKSNVQQRRGRSGRCREGVFFKLFSKIDFDRNMPDHEIPEMSRTPVEELCLQVKALKLPGRIIDVLNKAIAPPKKLAVKNAIQLLKGLGALEVVDGDESEVLTPLGWKLSLMPLHPCLGKMLLLGHLLGEMATDNENDVVGVNSSKASSLLTPHLLSICATLGFKPPFVLPLGKEKEADSARKKFGRNCANSDHILFAKVMMEYNSIGRNQLYRWCDRWFLSSTTLEMTEKMRTDLLGYVKDLFCSNVNLRTADCRNSESFARRQPNKYQKNHGFLETDCVIPPTTAALLHAVLSVSLNLSALPPSQRHFCCVLDGIRSAPHPSSLNDIPPIGKKKRKTNSQNRPEYLLVAYFERLKTSSVYLRDTSVVIDCLPLVLLLPGIEMRENNEDMMYASSASSLAKQPWQSTQHHQQQPAVLELRHPGDEQIRDSSANTIFTISNSEDNDAMSLQKPYSKNDELEEEDEEDEQKSDEEDERAVNKDKLLFSIANPEIASLIMNLRKNLNLLLEHLIGRQMVGSGNNDKAVPEEACKALAKLANVLVASYKKCLYCNDGLPGRDCEEIRSAS